MKFEFLHPVCVYPFTTAAAKLTPTKIHRMEEKRLFFSLPKIRRKAIEQRGVLLTLACHIKK